MASILQQQNTPSEIKPLDYFSDPAYSANWCRAISDDMLLLPAPDVTDTSLLWDCCSVQPAQSAEKVSVSQLNSLWHWHTSRLASWMARWCIVWCWSEIFSSVASTAAWYSSYIVDQMKLAFEWSICSLSKLLWWKINLMLFACPKFGPYGNLFIQMANCMQVGRTVGM